MADATPDGFANELRREILRSEIQRMQVLAVALACWWAERSPFWGDDAIRGGGESIFDNVPEGVFNEAPKRWDEMHF
jgi:hypothetical protein